MLKGGLDKRKAHQILQLIPRTSCTINVHGLKKPKHVHCTLKLLISLGRGNNNHWWKLQACPSTTRGKQFKLEGKGKFASRSLKYFDYFADARNEEVAFANSFHYLPTVENHNPNGTLNPIRRTVGHVITWLQFSTLRARLLQLAFFAAKGRKAGRHVTITQPLKKKKINKKKWEWGEVTEKAVRLQSASAVTCHKEYNAERLAAAPRRWKALSSRNEAWWTRMRQETCFPQQIKGGERIYTSVIFSLKFKKKKKKKWNKKWGT